MNEMTSVREMYKEYLKDDVEKPLSYKEYLHNKIEWFLELGYDIYVIENKRNEKHISERTIL